MENLNLYCLIYELKGIVKCMSDLIEQDETYNNPMIDTLEDKMNEIMRLIETKSA